MSKESPITARLLLNVLLSRPAELAEFEIRIVTLAERFMTNALTMQLVALGLTEIGPVEAWKAVTPKIYANAAEYALAAAIAVEQPLREIRTKLEQVTPKP